MSVDIPDRLTGILGRKMKITVSWNTHNSEDIFGKVTGGFSLGRGAFIMLNDGAVAIETSHIVMMCPIDMET
ncbi:MAG: hypothetical protein ACXABY_00560 [Candidatus Thorarchaeota archaeon]|jgi:hypothetical protein